jgi:hypothetical protein
MHKCPVENHSALDAWQTNVSLRIPLCSHHSPRASCLYVGVGGESPSWPLRALRCEWRCHSASNARVCARAVRPTPACVRASRRCSLRARCLVRTAALRRAQPVDAAFFAVALRCRRALMRRKDALARSAAGPKSQIVGVRASSGSDCGPHHMPFRTGVGVQAKCTRFRISASSQR